MKGTPIVLSRRDFPPCHTFTLLKSLPKFHVNLCRAGDETFKHLADQKLQPGTMPVYHICQQPPHSKSVSTHFPHALSCLPSTLGVIETDHSVCKLAALYKKKEDATPAQMTEFTQAAQKMVGQVPGLLSLDSGMGAGYITERFGQGWDMGVVIVFSKMEDLMVYEKHPAHLP